MTINEELLKEVTELRKKLSDNEDTSIAELSSKFQILSKKPMKIHGVLIAEGIWKGVLWRYEEMKKVINELMKLNLLVQHGETKEFKTKLVGNITKLVPNDMLKAILFEADVTDEKAIELVKKGILDAVSIKGMWKMLDTTKMPPEGVGFDPIEFSLTPSPACKNCLIFNYELEKDINKDNKSRGIGEYKMNKGEMYIKEGIILVPPEFEKDQKESKFTIIDLGSFEMEEVVSISFKLPEGYYPEDILVCLSNKEPKYPFYNYIKVEEQELAKWTRKYINDLPNSAFAVVEPCADKNKNARHLPYKDATGKVDKAHLRNARARMNQVQAICPGVSDESIRSKAKRVLDSVAKRFLKSNKMNKESEDIMKLSMKKCPLCGDELEEGKKAFRIHWLDKHERKFGIYKNVANFAKEFLTDKELRNRFKSVIELSEEEPKEEETVEEPKEEEKKPEEVKEPEKVPEPKKEEEKPVITKDFIKEAVKEVLKEMKEEETPKEEEKPKKEKKEEEPKEEPEKPTEPQPMGEEEAKKLIDPVKAAELLIKSSRGTIYGKEETK